MTYDSIIFDMAGTLWDAVDSYAAIWNRTLADCSVRRPPVTRDELISLMGKPLAEIAAILVPGLQGDELKTFTDRLRINDAAMLPGLGGKLYPGVRDTMERLMARGVRLFMLSNCGPQGIPVFLDYTGLGPFVTDYLSYGSTGHDKDVNIRTLVARYNLVSPLYVGDTVGDLLSTRRAGIPFAWASYGFGLDFNPADADIVLSSFSDLAKI